VNAKRWLAGLGVVVLLDSVIALVVSFMALAENCDNGNPRWQCSDSLNELLVAALIAVPAFYVTLIVVVAMRAWVERRESTPN
jgi:hypothetical protein